MRIEDSCQRHRRRRIEFDWRPGELVVGPKRRDSAVIGGLSAGDLDAVKAWVASDCEGPQPRLTGARPKDDAPEGKVPVTQ
jgi:hypothetical protein